MVRSRRGDDARCRGGPGRGGSAAGSDGPARGCERDGAAPGRARRPAGVVIGETPTSRELTAVDVAGAPVPGAENGRVDPPAGDSIWRLGLRGILFVPRVAADMVLSPVKLTAWPTTATTSESRGSRA
jgi:hypothetical protein